MISVILNIAIFLKSFTFTGTLHTLKVFNLVSSIGSLHLVIKPCFMTLHFIYFDFIPKFVNGDFEVVCQ